MFRTFDSPVEKATENEIRKKEIFRTRFQYSSYMQSAFLVVPQKGQRVCVSSDLREERLGFAADRQQRERR